MRRLIKAEFRRLLTTSLWRWGPLAAVICGGVLVGLATLAGPENFEPPMPGMTTEEGVRTVLSLIGLTVIVPALFGATAVTSEYRHKTITFTFLFAPRRHTVLAAKLLAYAVAGAVYGMVVTASAAVGLYGGAALRGVTIGAEPGTVAELLLRLAAAMTVYTVLGVGIGALLRNQTAALAVLGLYLYMVEHALALIPGVNLIYPYLPGGATAALTDFTLISQAAAQISVASAQLLSPLLGALVLAAYAVTAAVLAIAAPMRRDVI
ncbi:ABC transporter permease [Streptosporangium sp. NBC_01469]|uniref:ABC transporter permease n=1 Tax=Streptosporangium sp. NBC_01469 TaxID=2903898 RepID=UPI002E2CC27A|nr:ABC transporter permease [Streptosporangium sp. NBC_01469]